MKLAVTFGRAYWKDHIFVWFWTSQTGKRVLRPNGRVAISDIVSNRPVPISLQQDPDLWSGCISGAWQEDEFLLAFESIGFKEVNYAERAEAPWKVIDNIEFRSVTLVGHL